MSGTRMVAVSSILLLALSGCGGQKSDRTVIAPEPEEPTAEAGSLVQDALVDVRCGPNADGIWSAAGALRNRTKKEASYDVLVYVGPADGKPDKANVKRIDDVKPGKQADFEVVIGANTTPTGPCRVQVRTAAETEED